MMWLTLCSVCQGVIGTVFRVSRIWLNTVYSGPSVRLWLILCSVSRMWLVLQSECGWYCVPCQDVVDTVFCVSGCGWLYVFRVSGFGWYCVSGVKICLNTVFHLARLWLILCSMCQDVVDSVYRVSECGWYCVPCLRMWLILCFVYQDVVDAVFCQDLVDTVFRV